MKTILAVSVFASLSLPVMSVAASVYENACSFGNGGTDGSGNQERTTVCGDRYIGRHKAFRSV